MSEDIPKVRMYLADSIDKEFAALRAENERLRTDKRELVEALKDFVKIARLWNYYSCQSGWPEKGRCLCNGCVTLRGEAAVAKHKGE